jgi:hypothetical protein
MNALQLLKYLFDVPRASATNENEKKSKVKYATS